MKIVDSLVNPNLLYIFGNQGDLTYMGLSIMVKSDEISL